MTQLIDLGKLRFYWTGEWDNTTQYEVNDVCKYGGDVFIYTNTLATTGVLPTATTHWALLIEGIRFQGVYDPTRTYRVGEGAAYGSTIYLALVDNTGIAPTDATNGATTWTRFLEGLQFEGNYSATTAYQKGDIVVYGPSAFVAKRDSTGNLPTNTTYWAPMVSGVGVQGVYSAGTTYLPGQVVAYGARLYQATQERTGVAPAGATGTVATGWQLFVDTIAQRGDWATGVQYYVNDVVNVGGTTFIALRTHTSTAAYKPTDPANGATYWRKFNSGVRWRGNLTASTGYLVDDIFTDGLNTWIVTAEFTSNANAAQVPSDYSASIALLARGADYLPAQANQAGKFLTTNGTTPSWAYPNGQWKTVAPGGTGVTTNTSVTPNASVYSPTDGENLFVDTSTNVFSLTLPTAPVVGSTIRVADVAGTFGTRACTLNPGSLKINGVVDTLVLNVKNASVTLVYSGTAYGWQVV